MNLTLALTLRPHWSSTNEGEKEWQGESSMIMGSDDQKLTDFIFASDLLKNMRQMVIDHGLTNTTR